MFTFGVSIFEILVKLVQVLKLVFALLPASLVFGFCECLGDPLVHVAGSRKCLKQCQVSYTCQYHLCGSTYVCCGMQTDSLRQMPRSEAIWYGGITAQNW